jgi:hypothetical protein
VKATTFTALITIAPPSFFQTHSISAIHDLHDWHQRVKPCQWRGEIPGAVWHKTPTRVPSKMSRISPEDMQEVVGQGQTKASRPRVRSPAVDAPHPLETPCRPRPFRRLLGSCPSPTLTPRPANSAADEGTRLHINQHVQ